MNRKIIELSYTTMTTLFVFLFTALKLTDHIDWSWLWVFSPWWGPLCLVLAALLAFLGAWSLYQVAAFPFRWWRRRQIRIARLKARGDNDRRYH